MQTVHKRTILIATIITLQFIGMYALVQNLENQLAQQFISETQLNLRDLADGITEETQDFLRPVENAVTLGINLLSDSIVDESNDQDLERFFLSQLNNISWLSGMYLGRPNGSFVYVARNEFGVRSKIISIKDTHSVEVIQRNDVGDTIEKWLDSDDNYDPRTRLWYKKAKATEGLVWTDPYTFFSSGLPGISVAAENNTGSVLGADLDIHALSAFISRLPHAEQGKVVVIDEQLRAIAYPDSEKTAFVIQSSEIPTLDQVAGKPLKSLYASSQLSDESVGNRSNIQPDYENRKHLDSQTSMGTKAKLSDNQPPATEMDRSVTGATISLSVNNESYLGLVRPLSLSEGRLNWTLMIQVPVDDYHNGAVGFFNRNVLLLGIPTIALGIMALLGTLLLTRSSARYKSDNGRDELTGALFENQFEEQLKQHLQKEIQLNNNGQRAVMVIELKGFRYLVDRAGRNTGNVIMKNTCQILQTELTDEDLFGRANQGRLLLSFTGNATSELLERVQRIHALVKNDSNFDTPLAPEKISVSSGAAIFEVGEPVGNLLQRAREALLIGIEMDVTNCQIASTFNEHHARSLDQAA